MNMPLYRIVRQLTIILPFTYMGLIWYLSSKPSDAVINTHLTFDAALKEAMHLIEFSALYILWVLAFLSLGKMNQKTNSLLAIVSAFYGFVDEFHQYFVPSRTATITDLLKDVTGVLIAWYIVRRAYKNPNSKIKLILDTIEKTLRGTPLTRKKFPLINRGNK